MIAMEYVETRIPDVLRLLPDVERGAFSRAISSSAKVRMAVLERRLDEARGELRRFESKYGRDFSAFESGFADDADMSSHDDLVGWAFWRQIAIDCSSAINGYRLLIGE